MHFATRTLPHCFSLVLVSGRVEVLLRIQIFMLKLECLHFTAFHIELFLQASEIIS